MDEERTVRRLIERLRHGDACARWQAANALGEMGSAARAALPALAHALRTADEFARGDIWRAWVLAQSDSVSDLLDLLKHRDPHVRAVAAGALGEHREAAQLVIPALLTVVTDRSDAVQYSAQQALVEFSRGTPEAVPALIKALDHRSVVIRSWAMHALGEIGTAARAAVPRLRAAERRGPRRQRGAAARARVKIQSDSIAALLAALRERSPAARMAAADCVAERGPEALGDAKQEAVALLVCLLDDVNWDVQLAASTALGELGPIAAPGAGALIADLMQKRRSVAFRAWVRWTAAWALGRIGPGAEGAGPALAEALGDSDQYLRRQAAISLRKVGPQSADALPALMDALSYRAPPMPRRLKRDRQGFVHDVFGSTRAPDDAASQTMAQWRARAESEVHSVAIWALGQLGEAAAPAVPDIVRHLQQGEPTVRCTAATALGRMASARSEVVSALTDALTDDKPWVRQAAAGALGRIGPEAASAVAGLREALSDRHTRKAAVWALGKIGPSAAEAAPALVALLRDRSPRRQELAVRALQRIGPAAVPAVAQALRSGRETVRLNAAAVLGSFGPQAAPAMAALEKAMADTRPQVREALCWALRAIRGGPEASRDPGGDG